MSDRRKQMQEGARKAPSASRRMTKRPLRRLAAQHRLRGVGRQERA